MIALALPLLVILGGLVHMIVGDYLADRRYRTWAASRPVLTVEQIEAEYAAARYPYSR